ncbi:MAG: trypsin-like peptidase domain-containing protein [Actinomycetota bacterium]
MNSDGQVGVFTVGRSSDNDLTVSDDSVSGHHAEIFQRDGRWWIRDIQSSNGTYVNGHRTQESTILRGDRINFGVAEFVFDGQIPVPAATYRVPTIPTATIPQGKKLSSPNNRGSVANWRRYVVIVFSLGLVVAIVVVVLLRNSGSVTTTGIARATVHIFMVDDADEPCWVGSGAIIGNGSQIVTNAHVVETDPQYEGCNQISVGLSDDTGRITKNFIGARIIGIDHDLDLAVLELEEGAALGVSPLEIFTGKIDLGQEIRVFGYPAIGGESLTISSGIVSGLLTSDNYPYYKTTADISGGNSGGPVVDSRGRLIGIATAISRQEVFCDPDSNCYAEGNALGLVRPITLLDKIWTGG